MKNRLNLLTLKTLIIHLVYLLSLVLALNCSHTKPEPLPSDPAGSFISTDKEITYQHKRTIGFQNAGVWVSNEFDGARLNDFYQENDSVYTALMIAENAPINNSAWYAFKIWANQKRAITVNLTYQHGTHRYFPKISKDGQHWSRLDSIFYTPDTANGTAVLRLTVDPDTLWVAGQELIVSRDFDRFLDEFAALPFVTKNVIGHSKLGKPLYKLNITEAREERDYVIVIGRQHPPEVTGTLGLIAFLRAVCGDSDLAKAFRRKFCVIAIPLINPDGVDNGHWRHNAAGVDLNRDWISFNQPETRAAKKEFMKIADDSTKILHLFLDFHSTRRNIFYTMSKDLQTFPKAFTKQWLNKIKEMNPGYEIVERPSGFDRPISKNWFYKTFKTPSITYEFGDETDREVIRKVASSSAMTMMALLMAERSSIPSTAYE